jgi:hypothetical protein
MEGSKTRTLGPKSGAGAGWATTGKEARKNPTINELKTTGQLVPVGEVWNGFIKEMTRKLARSYVRKSALISYLI